uniref:Uncharacterized protein n=1 Tax=Siphoviridae sp. ct2wG4 TaxID=2826278 RepID=A0A8S5QXN0_9CAUD|nr:MAG TPA: hypothetical protein [Siphoviridae sp. ct2wG4]DAU49702.1 MAG TPA: hypothetical protein [Caudoviricetes sp.]
MQKYILFLTNQLFLVNFPSQNVILSCKLLLCTQIHPLLVLFLL